MTHSLRDVGGTVEQRAHDTSPVLADRSATGKLELLWHDSPAEAYTWQVRKCTRGKEFNPSQPALYGDTADAGDAPVKPPSFERDEVSIAHSFAPSHSKIVFGLSGS